MTVALLSAQSVYDLVRKAIRSATQGVRDYVATNNEAAERVAALSERWRETRSALGEYVLGGENAAVITGALTGLLDELSASSGDVADRQRMVRSALAGVIDVMAVGAQVVGVLRVAWGGLQVAIAVAGRTFEALTNTSMALGLRLIEYVADPIALVVSGLAALARGAAMLGSVVGGPVERATAGLADAATGMSDTVTGAMERLRALSEASARGAMSAFDGLGNEIDAIGQSTVAAYIRIDDLTARLHNLADETRSGAAASRSLRREIDQTASALSAAQAQGGVQGAQGAIAAAMEAARAALAAKESALAEQSALNSEAKAQRIIAAEESIVAARAAVLEQTAIQEQALRDMMARRAEVTQRTGVAIGESLALAVSAQKDASQQIIGVIARELQARIIAAIAAAGIFSATPGGQLFAGALIGAVGAAVAALSSIGGGGGKGGGKSGGGGGATIGAVNVSVYNQGNGGQSDTRAITSAVEEGIRRGTIRMRGA